MKPAMPVALSIAGSDSGGGAGVQMDLRAMHALAVFGTTAITAVTAQNLDEVAAVHALPAAAVIEQIEAVRRGFDIRAVKTGMLWSAETVRAVADCLRGSNVPLVVDPVLIASSGAALLQHRGLAAYQNELLPLATLTTPNLEEAAALLGQASLDRQQMPDAAATLARLSGCSVLLKGGHLEGDPGDVLWHAGRVHAWQHRRVEGVSTHGTGCMLSAAIAACLAQEMELLPACERSIALVQHALLHAWQLQPAWQVLGMPSDATELHETMVHGSAPVL